MAVINVVGGKAAKVGMVMPANDGTSTLASVGTVGKETVGASGIVMSRMVGAMGAVGNTTIGATGMLIVGDATFETAICEKSIGVKVIFVGALSEKY
jgi:hypothetical protein